MAIDVKALISDALLELCNEKPLSKISISDIQKKSGVSRQTFYNHFRDKNDLIQQDVYKRQAHGPRRRQHEPRQRQGLPHPRRLPVPALYWLSTQPQCHNLHKQSRRGAEITKAARFAGRLACRKSLAEFRALWVRKGLELFSAAYVAENTFRGSSVELSAFGGQPRVPDEQRND